MKLQYQKLEHYSRPFFFSLRDFESRDFSRIVSPKLQWCRMSRLVKFAEHLI